MHEKKKIKNKNCIEIFHVKVQNIVLKMQNCPIILNFYIHHHIKILTNIQLESMVNVCNHLSKFISSPSPTQISSQISYPSPTQSPPKALGRRFGRRFGRRLEEKGNPDMNTNQTHNGQKQKPCKIIPCKYGRES